MNTLLSPTAAVPADPESDIAGDHPPVVAIKIARRSYAKSALREVEAYRAIDRSHPGSRYLIRLENAFFVDGHICMVFERHGVELGDWLKAHGPFSAQETLRIARQLLMAITCMHHSGFAHADVKPANILWDPVSREVRLIDLGWAHERLKRGQAIATREYCPPEMLLGLEMGHSVDLWGLACSLYEILTGEKLFRPYAACEAKYEEFASSAGDEETESTASEDPDDVAEEAEQYPAGFRLLGKYRLEEELGRGKFGTVWSAQVLPGTAADAPLPAKEEARRITKEARSLIQQPATEGLSIWEVVIGYEHFLLMQELLGEFPADRAREGHYHYILYEPDGRMRFQPEIRRNPLAQRLREKTSLTNREIEMMESVLLPMLAFDPNARPTAQQSLARLTKK